MIKLKIGQVWIGSPKRHAPASRQIINIKDDFIAYRNMRTGQQTILGEVQFKDLLQITKSRLDILATFKNIAKK